MDSTVTQLRIAAGLVSAEGSGVHAANAGRGQRQPGGGGRRLFSLRQGLKMYDSIQERIVDYEKEILRKLGEMERTECRGQAVPPLNNPQKAKLIRKRGEEFMRQALYRMSGVDLTGKTPRERCSS